MTRTGIVRELNNLEKSGIFKIYRDSPSLRIYYFSDSDCKYRKIARVYIFKTDPICFKVTFNIPEKNDFHDIDMRYCDFKSMADFRKWLGSAMQKYLYN